MNVYVYNDDVTRHRGFACKKTATVYKIQLCFWAYLQKERYIYSKRRLWQIKTTICTVTDVSIWVKFSRVGRKEWRYEAEILNVCWRDTIVSMVSISICSHGPENWRKYYDKFFTQLFWFITFIWKHFVKTFIWNECCLVYNTFSVYLKKK